MVAPICPTICSGAGGAGAYSATKISDPGQIVPAGAPVEEDFTAVIFDVGSAITPDLADNALVIQQDGFYELIASEAWVTADTSVFAMAIMVNNVLLVSSSISESLTTKAGTLSALVELSAGDRITVQLATSAEATFFGTLSAEKRN